MFLTKICTKCLLEKELYYFHKNKKGFLGTKAHCKDCCSIIAKNEDKEKRRSDSSKYKKANNIKVNSKNKIWRFNNPDKVKQYTLNNKINNKGTRARLDKERKSHVKQAKIGNYNHDINIIYSNSLNLELLDGIRRHVHHIIPLQEFSDIVCGLHVPWNLEILTEEEHKDKHRRLDELYKTHGTL